MATQLKAVPETSFHLGNLVWALACLRDELLSLVQEDADSIDITLDQYDGRPALAVTFHLKPSADTVRAKFAIEMTRRPDMVFHNVTLRRVGSSATKFMVTAVVVPA